MLDILIMENTTHLSSFDLASNCLFCYRIHKNTLNSFYREFIEAKKLEEYKEVKENASIYSNIAI